MKRREFLTRSAALGAAIPLAATPAVLTSCSTDRNSRRRRYTPEELGMYSFVDIAPDGAPLRAALIGCGDRGTGAAFNFLDSGPNVELVAMADILPDRMAQSKRWLARRDKPVVVDDSRCFFGFDAYKKVLELPDVDVVLLTTPNHFRPEQFRAAVEANKHIFMEKCCAIDPVGIRSIIASSRMATARGLTVVTGNQRRHRRDYWEAFVEVKNGLIGDVVAATCHWDQGAFWDLSQRPEWSDMEYQLRNWFNVKWLSGDHVLDQGIHNIDIATWFMGDTPAQAAGYGGRARRRSGDIYDFFAVDYTYADGKQMLHTARQIHATAGNISERILGTKGIAQLNESNEIKIVDWEGNTLWEYDYVNNPIVNSAYLQEHIHMVESIRLNKRINQAEELAISNQVAILGREAAYTGRAITWEEIMASTLRYGPTPDEYALGPIAPEHFQEGVVPIPGLESTNAVR
jgi:predicted dehydrogenase